MIEGIVNGRVVDPSRGIDRILDIWIQEGRILRIEEPSSRRAGDRVIDATGRVVVPGLIDMHVHFREPGYEYKETIATGSRAAAAGGITSVACMANTEPVNDHGAITEYILKKAREEACIRVYPVGAITRGLKGETLSEIGELKEAGVVALSDDGVSVRNSELLRRAMEYARGFGLLLISHCEDKDLTGGGVMNEGVVSTQLGLLGMPGIAEEIVVARDILLARTTGCRLHIAHVSTEGSANLIRRAKAEGIPVTAEVTPHHLVLTEEACRDYDTHTKVNPPLRTQRDVEALRMALLDGTIDAIATDHAPHSMVEKEREFDDASFGIVGLETAFPLTYELVRRGCMSLSDLIARWTLSPARILGIEGGTLSEGSPADMAIIDTQREYVIDRSRFRSKGRNTPFHGRTVQGFVEKTIVGGRLVYDASNMRGT